MRQHGYDDAIRRSVAIGHIERELGESAFGAIVGAVTGAIAGLPGVVVGAICGALAGLLAGIVAEREEMRAAYRNRTLDDTIGVTHGSLGTRWVRHVPPRIGAYSSSSSGGGTTLHDTIPVEGPMPEDGA
jgi:hypothetical protein